MLSRGFARAVSLMVGVIVALGAGASPALAETHPFVSSFGRTPSEPFTNPNGIAVDESTGDVYVAQIGTSEQQTVSIQGGPESGGFTLEFKGKKTSVLSVSGTSAPSAEAVQSALRALSTIGSAKNSNVTVTEEGALPGTVTYTVSFQGELATVSLPQLVCDGSMLTGGTSPACTVATTVPGVGSTVSKFDASGNPIESWGAKGTLDGSTTAAGSFAVPNAPGNPAAIAVDNSKSPSDPSAGDLYVMDAGHGVVDKFTPSGAYLSQIAATGVGLGVDASGNVRVLDPGREGALVQMFDNSTANYLVADQSANTVNGGWEPPKDADGYEFAVGPTGDDYLFATSPGIQSNEAICSCIMKFGSQLAALGQVDNKGSADVAVAADPATGHIYIDDQSSVVEWDTGSINGSKPISSESEVHLRESSGAFVSSFGSFQLSGSSGQGGIAVNGVTGEIYVSNPADGKVYVFGSDVPGVAAGAASGVTKETATLNGTVDPRGAAVTSCQFEYAASNQYGQGAYGQSVPCKQTPSQIGEGTSAVPVSAEIEGLRPGLLYHFRLAAVNAGGSGTSSGLFATAGPGFGIKGFEVSFLNEDGTPDTQAGSHPYELVNEILYNTKFVRLESNADSIYVEEPDGTLKDLTIDLPPGLVGDPNATAKKCMVGELDLRRKGSVGTEGCPAESALGELRLEWTKIGYPEVALEGQGYPISNMVPPRGVAVQFGTPYVVPNLYLNNSVLAGGDYPVQATVTDAPPEVPLLSSRTIIHGVVGSGSTRKAFLTLPTGCHGPLRSTISADSWQNPGHFAHASYLTSDAAGAPVSLTGCSKLQFPPTISISPDVPDASSSSGLTVGVHISQKAALNPDGLAESSLRDTTVTLPEGVAINPAGADGLEACSSDPSALPEGALGSPGDQIGYLGSKEFNAESEPGVATKTFTPEVPSPLQPGVNFCPNGSKIGTVKINTPLLSNPLEGAVYLAAQNQNPFGSLVAMYMVAEDPVSGSLIKLTGEVKLTDTGQIVTTFKNTPDLPFEDLELHFFGGERAPLTTPSRCGTYTTQATFVPWDGNGPVNTSSSFQITSGPNGGPCPGASLPFVPSLTAGTTSIQAGGFSPFTMTMSRPDGSQNLQAISLKMPSGLSGLLTGVELCPEPQASLGLCGPNSQIGETIVSVGVGNDPFSVKGGRVYLTGPYEGAPFGLSIVNPAKAGPYDLEQGTPCDCVLVRAKIEVDPITAALTVTSDNTGPYKIPTILKGIPLQIQHVNVTINRPGFTFNPTNCNPSSITGSLDSTEGAVDALSVPFQATNCARLSFKPQFSVSTSGKTSRANGASLHVKLVYPKLPFGFQANIASVKVDLPRQLPSRLTTLQKACPDKTFNENPAVCPAASRVGTAKAVTPLVPVPLEGPVYFVSHGGAKFPELVVVLSGYGVTVDLHSETFISKAGITSSTFRTIPDAPVGTFELTLPQGQFSALAANGNLCKSTLAMPTAFTAQNGMTIKQSTPINVTTCAKHKKKAKTSRHNHRHDNKKGKKR